MALLNVSSDIQNNSDRKPSLAKANNSKQQLSLNDQVIESDNFQQTKATDKLYKISGVVFLDNYMNSIYEKDSKGINNIKLSLFDKNDNLISETTTKKFFHLSGYYEFNNIPEGKYKIAVSVPYAMKVSDQLLKYYYGSKINPKSNSVTVIISNKDITDTFIGLYIL